MMNFQERIFEHEDKFRKSFEEKYRGYLSLDLTENGVYVEGNTRLAWSAWVAAHETLLNIERPKPQ